MPATKMRRSSMSIRRRDLARDAGDDRGLAGVANLIFGSKPVPALLAIRARGLRGIDDDESVLVGEGVHPRARREVVGRLRAAVQHDDHRHPLARCNRIAAPGRRPCTRARRLRRRMSARGIRAGRGRNFRRRLADRTHPARRAARSIATKVSIGRATSRAVPSIVRACALGASGRCMSPAAESACSMVSVTPFIGPRASVEARGGERTLDRFGDAAHIEPCRRSTGDSISDFSMSAFVGEPYFSVCDRPAHCELRHWRETHPILRRTGWWRGPAPAGRRRRCARGRRRGSAAFVPTPAHAPDRLG